MTPDEARKLLGGYATGTLTDAEEQALFAAALEDQSLFDELAREQSLRDLLRDPAAKGHLLAALDGPRRVWWRSWKPAAVLAMAGVATVAVAIGTRKSPPPVQIVAQVAPAPAPPTPEIVPPAAVLERRDTAPAPAPRRKLASPPPASVAAPPVELAEAPKVEALNKAEATPKVLADAAVVIDSAPSGGVPAPQLAAQGFVPSTADSVARARIVGESRTSARALFQATTATPLRVQPVAAQAPQNFALGLRYSIVQAEGQPPFLRITSNVNGYLSIGGGVPVSLTAMRPYQSESLRGDEVKVVFSRRPETFAAPSGVPLTEVSGGETYVVSPNGGALSFTIPLKKP